jgi:hypothetical protein
LHGAARDVTTTLPAFLHRPDTMTNRSAFILALILIAAITVDVMIYGSEHIVFLGKKLADLLEWMAFWR